MDVKPAPPAPPEGSHWDEPPFDAIRHCNAWQCPATHGERGLRSNLDLFGQPHLYANGTRQLARATPRQHGLHNDNT